jgi:hypothetical protein
MGEFVRDLPIPFNGEMMRALLDGSKTQTRRIVKAKPSDECPKDMWPHALKDIVEWREQKGRWFGLMGWRSLAYANCPYGQPGDRLWVREAIRLVPNQRPDDGSGYVLSAYAADGSLTVADAWPWKRSYLPPMHCPRGLSRMLLEVTSVRVERVQEISERDAQAEGIVPRWPDGVPIKHDCSGDLCRPLYRELWDSLNEARGFGWDVNPWVWVIEFKQVDL